MVMRKGSIEQGDYRQAKQDMRFSFDDRWMIDMTYMAGLYELYFQVFENENTWF